MFFVFKNTIFYIFCFSSFLIFLTETSQKVFFEDSLVFQHPTITYVTKLDNITRTLNGQILDAITLEPVKNAQVEIGGQKTQADERGGFKFSSLQQSFVDISITADVKYEKYEKYNIYLSKENSLTFHLRQKINERDNKIDNLFKNLNSFISTKAQGFIEPTNLHHMTNTAMHSFLKDTVTKCSDIMQMYKIGESVNGVELWVVEVSENPGIHEPGKPEVKYIGNMHGNEVVGRVLLLALLEYICTNKNQPFIQSFLATTRLHILPTMNPDGYSKAHPVDVDGLLGRPNQNGTDLNRNFPDQFGVFKDNKQQTVETKYVMAWVKSHPFVLSANLHGGSLVANYPFDGNPSGNSVYTKAPDDDVFRMLALSYSSHNSKMSHDPQCIRDHFDKGITNGAAWYALTGGMQDWNYLNTNCFELTLELSCTKYPADNNLPSYWEDNKFSLFNYVIQAHKGIKGYVRDSYTGLPIKEAQIYIEKIQHAINSTELGEFWRMLVPGTYTVVVAKQGYYSKTLHTTVNNTTSTTIVVQLDALPPSSWQQAWSRENDHDLESNMADEYLTSDDVERALEKEVKESKGRLRIESVQISGEGEVKVVHFNNIKPHKRESKRRKMATGSRVLLTTSSWKRDFLPSNLLIKYIRSLLAEQTTSHHILDHFKLSIMPVLHRFNRPDTTGCKADTGPDFSLPLIPDFNNYDLIISFHGGFAGVGTTAHIREEAVKDLKTRYNRKCQFEQQQQTSTTQFGAAFPNVSLLTFGLDCCSVPPEGIPLLQSWIEGKNLLDQLLADVAENKMPHLQGNYSIKDEDEHKRPVQHYLTIYIVLSIVLIICLLIFSFLVYDTKRRKKMEGEVKWTALRQQDDDEEV